LKRAEIKARRGAGRSGRPAARAGEDLRTKLSTCLGKGRFVSAGEALAAAAASGPKLRAYRCDRCGRFHLTSRTNGKRTKRPDAGGENPEPQ
jgi:hypothetical protein